MSRFLLFCSFLHTSARMGKPAVEGEGEDGVSLNIGLKFLKKVWGTKTPPSLSQAENVCP